MNRDSASDLGLLLHILGHSENTGSSNPCCAICYRAMQLAKEMINLLPFQRKDQFQHLFSYLTDRFSN